MEDQPFIEALRQVGDVFGCEPFLPEGSYRDKMARGRITTDDLNEILAEESGFDGNQHSCRTCPSCSLRLSMLQHSINPGAEHELHWMIAESDAIQRFRSEISHSVREQMIDSTRQWVSNGFPVSTSAWRPDSAEELMDVVQNAVPRTLLGGSGTLDEAGKT